MTQFQNYIFCPLCSNHNWKRIERSSLVQLTEHRCESCNNFEYTEVSKHMTSESGIQIFYKELYSEKVWVDDYFININHQENWTEIVKYSRVILKIPRAVIFDWYKENNIKDKIRKFLVFS